MLAQQLKFEREYAESNPGVVFDETHVSMPCICEDGGGPGHFAAVRNTKEFVHEHLDCQETLHWLRRRNVDRYKKLAEQSIVQDYDYTDDDLDELDILWKEFTQAERDECDRYAIKLQEKVDYGAKRYLPGRRN